MKDKIAAIALGLLLVGTASAGGPELINYQGILKDSENEPITGTVNVTFRFYDAITGGFLLLTRQDFHSAR